MSKKKKYITAIYKHSHRYKVLVNPPYKETQRNKARFEALEGLQKEIDNSKKNRPKGRYFSKPKILNDDVCGGEPFRDAEYHDFYYVAGVTEVEEIKNE